MHFHSMAEGLHFSALFIIIAFICSLFLYFLFIIYNIHFLLHCIVLNLYNSNYVFNCINFVYLFIHLLILFYLFIILFFAV